MKFKVITKDRSYTTDKRRKEAIRGLRLMVRLGRMAQRALNALKRDGHYDGVAPYVPYRSRGFHFTSATAATSYAFNENPVEKNFVMATFPLPVEPTLDWVPDISRVNVEVHCPSDVFPVRENAYAVVKIVGTVRTWQKADGNVVLKDSTHDRRPPYFDAHLVIGQVSFNFKNPVTLDDVTGFHCHGKSFTHLDDLKPHFHEVLAAAFVQTFEQDTPHEMYALQDVAAKWFKESGHADFVFETIQKRAHDIMTDDLKEMAETHLVNPVMEE